MEKVKFKIVGWAHGSLTRDFNFLLFNPRKTRGGGFRIIFLYENVLLTLLDFLHFNLTNLMVPNLTHVFLSDWVSGTIL